VDYVHPLLTADSPLGPAARALVEEVNHAEQTRTHSHAEQDLDDDARRERVELTRAELWDQPTAIRTTLTDERLAIVEAARRIAAQPIDRVYLIGCGDSLSATVAVRGLYENLLSVPCEPVQALDFAFYYHRLVDERSVVIALSSSGATARVVEGVLLARALGARTLGLSNTISSPLMSASEHVIFVHATRRGWPTQSTTAAMAALVQFAFELARHRGRTAEALSPLEAELDQVADHIGAAIVEHDRMLAGIAGVMASREVCLFTGGGPAHACAMLGAAKLKECSLKQGVALPLEEYHHYVSQRDGDPLFLIAPHGPTLQRALDTARSGRTWGGIVYGVMTRGERVLGESVDVIIALPPVHELLAPMVYCVPGQLFAYHVGMSQFPSLASKQ
jgi:glucosamine--fructose-6-phosphate aminotransferase (isomerizing)